jgi:succinoglycan biosynthesis transport protein ExoP
MAEEAQQREDTAAPLALMRMLRRRIGVVLICAVLVPAAALAFSLSQEKQYSASASLLFRDPQLDQKFSGSTVFAPSSDPNREAATNAKLASLGVVATRTSKALGGKLPPGEIIGKIVVAPAGQSDVVNITATDHDPAFAAKLANTFAQQFIVFRRDADRSKIAAAQQLVTDQLKRLSSSESTGPQGTALRRGNEQLQILAALQTGNAELVQPADTPGSPSSPQTKRNVIFAALFGIIMGCGLAVLLERLDRRLKDPKQVSDVYGRSVIGAVPESREIARAEQSFEELPTNEAEPMRMLRANLRYFNVDREVRSVLVTSAAPGEGKSTVAKHLASAAASTGERVLLLEADLRRPTLKTRMQLKSDYGLSQVLAGTCSLRSAIEQTEVAGSGGERRSLSVLASGPIPPNPTDLIESDRMRQVLKAVSDKYDLVVIDTPPTSVVSDAIPLVKNVDGVLVVARLGKTTRDASVHLRDQLNNLGAYVLGVVVNSVTRGSMSGYAYGYGYGYGYAAEYTSQKKKRRGGDRAPVMTSANGHSNGHSPQRELDLDGPPAPEQSTSPDYPDA